MAFARSQHFCLAAALFLSACATSMDKPPTELGQGSVTRQDFFFYSCVREYMKSHSIRLFDGSVAYGVEHSMLSAGELSRLYDAATSFALSIRAPDYADEEHGLPAVLVLCREQAEKLGEKGRDEHSHKGKEGRCQCQGQRR